MLPELTGEAKSYAERGFEFREVGALTPSAAAAALEEPARAAGVDWERAAVEKVVGVTKGYPYFIQEYGRVIWRIGDGALIRVEDVDRAEPVAREYLDDNFFSQRIGRLPDAERRYMAAVALLGDGPQGTAEVATVLDKSPQALSGIRDRLIKSSLLYVPRRGTVDFTVPLCADYIRREMPETRPSSEILDEMREDRV